MITVDEFEVAITSRMQKLPDFTAADIARVLTKNLGGVFLAVEIGDKDDAKAIAARMLEASTAIPQPVEAPVVEEVDPIQASILLGLGDSGGADVEMRDLVKATAARLGKPSSPRLVAQIKAGLAALSRDGRITPTTDNKYSLAGPMQ